MRFSSKQVVAMVACVSAAVVLAPVGVMAASGQLVHIVDPVLGDRKVRVGSAGSLQVETRPGVTSTAVNASQVEIADTNARMLAEATSPTRIALSEMTIGVRKFGSPVVAPTIVDLVQFVQSSGTQSCGRVGWTPTLLRRVTLKTDETLHLKFDGPPLIVPTPTAGKRFCLAVDVHQWVVDTRVDVGATVFTYS